MMRKACIIPKKTWGCKGASAKHWVKGMNTYAMYLFEFIFYKFTKLWKFKKMSKQFALSIWSVDWCGKKTNLKRFNIWQQHNKTWKNCVIHEIHSQGTVYIYKVYFFENSVLLNRIPGSWRGWWARWIIDVKW